MTRLSLIYILVAFLAACSGPIETRVANTGFDAVSVSKKYTFAHEPEQHNKDYNAVQNAVKTSLEDKGFVQTDKAPLLVEIALSDRPADIAISIGEDNAVKAIAAAKKRKPLQSCADREHRLKVLITDNSNGKILYQGEASEYHCKAAIGEVLPYLAAASLSDLGQTGSLYRTDIRRGIE